MAHLTNMKMSKADQKKQSAPASVSTDRPSYPWGLSLNLDHDSLKKLDAKDYDVGDELTLIATVKVSSVSSNETAEGKNRSLSLQITDMCLEKGGSAEEAAGTLYDKA